MDLFYTPNGEAKQPAPTGVSFCLTIFPFSFDMNHKSAKSMTASRSASASCSTSLLIP
jgi:hypothetical protein